MQIIEQKKQGEQLSDVEVFKNNIYGMFNQLKISHTSLMRVWEKPNAEEILRGIGEDAKQLFEQSYGIQMILKNADSDYEMITPYKIIEVDVPVLDEEGVEKLDKDGNVVTEKERRKVALQVSFNADGSINNITEA